MASDLSTLIQEGICSTLNGLLAKEATIKQTNKAVEQDLSNRQFLRVDSTFEFDNITSTWNFFIPAYTASLIFNTMLGDESEPVNEIDADIADAISEFISNLSGSLTTAINGAGFEDLGQSKFTIGTNEVIESVEDIANTYKFSIDLDGNSIELYSKYDDIILPFLTAILGSPETVYTEETPEEEIQEEEALEELVEEPSEPEEEIKQAEKEAAFQDEPVKEESPDTPASEEVTNSEEPEEEDSEDTQEDPKDKKLKLVIIVVGALLGLTIITGIVMYFMGMFDPAPPPVVDKNNTKMVKKVGDVEVIEYQGIKKTDFDPEMVDTARLNTRLEALTKYEVLSEEQIEEQELAEKERQYRIKKEQELIAFAAKNKEEDIFSEKESTTDTKEESAPMMGSNNSKPVEYKEEIQKEIPASKTTYNQITKDGKLKFVLVESLKYKLYKNLIAKVNTHQARISICKNSDGRTSVYIGPFNDHTMQEKMLELLQGQNVTDSKKIDLSMEEFDSRCNFE